MTSNIVRLKNIGKIPILWIGLAISFMGSISIGTLNMTVLQITQAKGIGSGLQFSAGAVIIEVLIVRLMLYSAHWLSENKRWMRNISKVTVFVLLGLALVNFMTAMSDVVSNPDRTPIYLSMPPVIMGMFMRILLPTMLTFWFGCNATLISQNILIAQSSQLNQYVIGIGLGTFLAHFLYATGGQLTATFLRNHHFELYCTMGCLFLGIAVGQIWQNIHNHRFEKSLLS